MYDSFDNTYQVFFVENKWFIINWNWQIILLINDYTTFLVIELQRPQSESISYRKQCIWKTELSDYNYGKQNSITILRPKIECSWGRLIIFAQVFCILKKWIFAKFTKYCKKNVKGSKVPDLSPDLWRTTNKIILCIKETNSSTSIDFFTNRTEPYFWQTKYFLVKRNIFSVPV